jgi:predicted deacetylase
MRALCVSIHDVAPRTLAACQHIADSVRQVDASIPLTLLVVPRYHGDTAVPKEYVRWIAARLRNGDELALHGYTHRDESSAPRAWTERMRRDIYTAGEGEFSALTREEAAHRIECGRRWFAERCWPVAGFVAPAWLMSPGTWEALQDFNFLYTTTLSRFHVLKHHASLCAPSVVYSTRNGWRRWASRVWNAALLRATQNVALVRVGFHPADAEYPHLMAHALELLRHALRTREALTKSAFALSVG